MISKGRQKHRPHRTCIVCRGIFPKREINRIVRSPEGNVYYDSTGKASGRGAYICNDLLCWEKAVSGNILQRTLKINLTPAHRTALQTELDRRKALSGRSSTSG